MQPLDPPTSDGRVVPAAPAASDPTPPADHPQAHLARLLLGDDAPVEPGSSPPLPPLVELTSATILLARGERSKVLLPLALEPLEWALVRRVPGAVDVSLYGTGPVPEAILLERPVPLAQLLGLCAAALVTGGGIGETRLSGEARRRLAARARNAIEEADHRGRGPRPRPRPRRVAVGSPDPRGDHVARDDAPPLELGCELRLSVDPEPRRSAITAERSDAHALLVPGRLWAALRGRHVPLGDAPVVPALLRCVHVVRVLVEAWERDRPAHVRLRAGELLVAARRDRERGVSLTFGTTLAGSVTVTDLDVPDVARPILRITADVVRALVAVDRQQSRNLRIRALRRELRELRRRVRRRSERASFTNADPDRLRASTPPPALPSHARDGSRPRAARPESLRFSERFRVELEALDAASTFLCGQVIVAASPQRTLAVGRDTGGLAWVREGLGGPSLMAGRTLVRVGGDGYVELCDVHDGEAFATTALPELAGRAPGRALTVASAELPPTLALAIEQRIVALDLRTGTPRWRVSVSQEGGPLAMVRAGRVLLSICAAGALHAIDAATGEVVWRAAGPTPYAHEPVVVGDRVMVVTAGESGAAEALDLYTGRRRWRTPLDGLPATTPLAAGRNLVVPLRRAGQGRSRRGSLWVLDGADGTPLRRLDDPGIARGGAACLEIDGCLVVNLPGGRVVGIDVVGDGGGWSRRLGDPLEDELPRRLEPVLRSGALFVPAAAVHLLRPADGVRLGDPLPSDLVPDFLRVDERGWVYVGEESGSLAAYAPVPHLRLVR